MTKELNEEQFTGRLTKAYREKLEQIRLAGALTYKEFGRLIGCSSSTVRSWMRGTKTRCQSHFVLALKILFSGALDDLMLSVRLAKTTGKIDGIKE